MKKETLDPEQNVNRELLEGFFKYGNRSGMTTAEGQWNRTVILRSFIKHTIFFS